MKGDSLASKGGLHAGDIVVKLAGKPADIMTHRDAQEAIIQSGDALEIIVERYFQFTLSIDIFKLKNLKQECIPVGCVPPAH